ncbi:MAG: EF2563 family selenium-dependent molybdenum hydroxylase system protein [Burkholderiales bacterium]|nr:EF2563 family selenium-dependent molybdenum hydroxylase system protein [Burkholderiales bacterium]
MLFPETLCVVRGGGDLATGVVHRLRCAGFPVLVLELDRPRVVRRMAAVAQAVYSGEIRIEGLVARRADALAPAPPRGAWVPVSVDPDGAAITRLRPAIVVDARMAKAPLDTRARAAGLVIGLGPGFAAGEHCHAVIETHRGHDLGRVLRAGTARPDTGLPEAVLGHRGERVLRAPADGVFRARTEIGDRVVEGAPIAEVEGVPIRAPFTGVVRGLLFDGLTVRSGEKVGDVDPRGEPRHCFSISDKALAVGGGVVEAVLTWLQER